MLLAELEVRHTRRHMPTRRIALDTAYLPTSGPGHGTSLLVGLFAEYLPALDDQRRDLLRTLIADARRGLTVPSIALRHRLQTDTHGLDRSRHRLLGESGRMVLEIDVHGAPVPQLLGAVLAASQLPEAPRFLALNALRETLAGRRVVRSDVAVRRLLHGHPVFRPPPAGVRWVAGAPESEREWVGVPTEIRWAMEVLGFAADSDLVRVEVNRHYRTLLRDAHPDHGGSDDLAAERISELTEARAILLDSDEVDASAVSSDVR